MIETVHKYTAKDLYNSVLNILKLRDISGTIDKQIALEIILQDELTLKLLQVLLDNSIVLGLKKIQEIGITTDTLSVSGSELLALIDELAKNNINDTLRNKVSVMLAKMPKEAQEVIQGILCKTFKVGVTAKTINKVRKGTISEFSCMLADSGDIDKFPVAVGLKYDGVRCVAFVYGQKVTMFTRQGNTLNIPNIERELVKLAKGSNYVFDGELITESRTAISGLVNSIMKTGYTELKGQDIKYKVFDVIPHNVFVNKEKSQSLNDRLLNLGVLFMTAPALHSVSEAIHTIAHNQVDVDKIYEHYIVQGEEGIIAKDLDAPYYYKRSKAWLKVKAINQCTLKVIGTTEGTNDRKGKIGALICTSECSQIVVNVGSGLTDDDLNTITPEGILGKYVEVVFNVLIKGEDSSVCSLFLPRLKANDWLRFDKTEADSLDKILKEHRGKPLI